MADTLTDSAPTPEPTPLDRACALMAAQGGVITRAQARAAGLRGAQIQTLLRRGTWDAPARGVYAPALDGDDVGAAHAVAVAARARRFEGRHAACGLSAALVLGVPILGRPPTVPQLVRAPRGPNDTAGAPGLHVARLDNDDVVECRGVLVTSPARTAVDVARTRPFRDAVVVADAVLQAGVPRTELERVLDRCSRWPGVVAARRVVAFADERAESPLESLDRVAFAEGDLPRPLTQVNIYAPNGLWLARSDFAFEAQRTVVEPDGLAKYRIPDGRPVPTWVDDALVKEKERETGIRRCGLEVVRNDWDEAFHRPADLCERVRQHFGFAARYPAVPGVRLVRAPMRWREAPTWPLEGGRRAVRAA
jgi:hypothetical protein